ncbi:hypothetical protein, partial [Frankia sp. CiP3]|uniref:hypothetical protein n=1 Tax=Frankia sp. CiP3 TaxID=2880971 RepID=UPI001EF628F3
MPLTRERLRTAPSVLLLVSLVTGLTAMLPTAAGATAAGATAAPRPTSTNLLGGPELASDAVVVGP